MLKILDKLPLSTLLIMGIMLALLPFQPEPHLLEKLRMLSQGVLSKPVDISDLLMHGLPPLLLIAKIIRVAQLQIERGNETAEK